MDPVATDSSAPYVTTDTDIDTDTDSGTAGVSVVIDPILPPGAFDPTDPMFTAVAVIVAITVTAAARKLSKVKPALASLMSAITPPFAILLAVFARAAADIVWGVPFSADVLGQGLFAGVGAVTGHTSWLSFTKHFPAFISLLFRKTSADE